MFHQKVAGIYRGIPPKKKIGWWFCSPKNDVTLYKFGRIGSFTVCPFFFLTKKRWIFRGIGCVCFEFRRLFLLIFFGLFLSQAQLLLFIAWLVPWGYIEEIFQDDFGILFGNQKKRWKKSPIST